MERRADEERIAHNATKMVRDSTYCHFKLKELCVGSLTSIF